MSDNFFAKTVAVTGSKGKTTVVNLAAYLLTQLGKSVASVDSTGSYIGMIQDTNLQDSNKTFNGKSPNLVPGRYLKWFSWDPVLKEQELVNRYAILETSIGCNEEGLGYNLHDIGVLTNIFEVHAATKEEVLERKSFIVANLVEGGHFITSGDDPFTLQLAKSKKISDRRIKLTLVTGGDMQKAEALQAEYSAIDVIYRDGEEIHSLRTNLLVNLTNYHYYSSTLVEESMIINLMFALAIINSADAFDPAIQEHVDKYILPDQYGRFAVFERDLDGKVIMIDYAHESNSLTKAIDFLRGYTRSQEIALNFRLSDSAKDQTVTSIAQTILDNNILQLNLFSQDLGVPKSVGAQGEALQKLINTSKPEVVTKLIPFENDAIKEALNSSSYVLHIHISIMERLLEFLKNEGFKRVF